MRLGKAPQGNNQALGKSVRRPTLTSRRRGAGWPAKGRLVRVGWTRGVLEAAPRALCVPRSREMSL